MNQEDLTTYLNDHLAGSVGALEMLDDMIQSHEGKPLEPFLEDLRSDIQSDQDELKELMRRLDVEESTMRKAGAWMVEKLSRTKLHRGDAGEANLALFQSLEALVLGITGKRSLWRTLAAAVVNSRQLPGLDFARLEARAADQIERVESQGLGIARQIFGPERRAAES
jgi:hypothetical protein